MPSLSEIDLDTEDGIHVVTVARMSNVCDGATRETDLDANVRVLLDEKMQSFGQR